MSFPTGATAILLFVCILSLFSTYCPNIIVLHSANTSEIQATKKPHNYHKIAVWQKDDRIRKSPLKFCVYHYSELEGDCQAAIITELCRREKLYLSTCLLIHIKVHRSKRLNSSPNITYAERNSKAFGKGHMSTIFLTYALYKSPYRIIHFHYFLILIHALAHSCLL